ncbi:MFS transporter [Halomicroarcula sp. GCM10025710]
MATVRRIRRAVEAYRRDSPRGLLVAVASGWFLVLGMRFVVPAVLPTIRAEFGISNADAGLAVTVLWMTYAAMQFPAGALVDRVGERVLLCGAALLSGVALLGYVVAPIFSLFVLATAGFGLGTGLYGPARGTLLSRTFDASEGVAFGAVMAAGSLGAAALPFVATLVTARFGWRLALASAAPLFVFVAVLLWLTVSDRATTPTDRRLRADLRAALSGFRSRRLLLAVTGATLMLFVFQGVTAFLTTYLVTVAERSQGTAGAMLAGLFVVGALAQPVTGRLADRYGSPRVLVGVALLSAVPLALVALWNRRARRRFGRHRAADERRTALERLHRRRAPRRRRGDRLGPPADVLLRHGVAGVDGGRRPRRLRAVRDRVLRDGGADRRRRARLHPAPRTRLSPEHQLSPASSVGVCASPSPTRAACTTPPRACSNGPASTSSTGPTDSCTPTPSTRT